MGGVVIGSDSVLLEHTLAMVGDVVEPGDIWQGWPVRAIAKAEDVAAAAKESEGGKPSPRKTPSRQKTTWSSCPWRRNTRKGTGRTRSGAGGKSQTKVAVFLSFQ